MADESIAGGFTEIAQRRDRVYATTDREVARAWASAWRNPATGRQGYGSLYRVEMPEGVEPDDDFLSLPGFSFQAPHAVVVAVYDAAVSPDNGRGYKALERAIAAHTAAKADTKDRHSGRPHRPPSE